MAIILATTHLEFDEGSRLRLLQGFGGAPVLVGQGCDICRVYRGYGVWELVLMIQSRLIGSRVSWGVNVYDAC